MIIDVHPLLENTVKALKIISEQMKNEADSEERFSSIYMDDGEIRVITSSKEGTIIYRAISEDEQLLDADESNSQ